MTVVLLEDPHLPSNLEYLAQCMTLGSGEQIKSAKDRCQLYTEVYIGGA